MKEWRKSKMMKNRWPTAYQVIETLEHAGFEAYVVGGAVRDFIRSVDANDVDITTNATPIDVKRLFSRTFDVGIEHGTVIVVLQDSIEVTTFRSEATYSDFRRPDQVTFVSSLREDLERRDFTMNAMALTKEDELIDYFDGKRDIANYLIRAVGEPNERFGEDALRMLRAVRFSAQLGYTLHEETMEAIQALHHLIGHVSIERVKVEIEKIWASKHVAKGLELFVSSKLADNFSGDWSRSISKWKEFTNFGLSANGWAFFALIQQPPNINTLLNHYKCSNAEKNHVKQIVLAVEKLEKGYWSNDDFYQFSEEVLIAASCYSAVINEISSSYSVEKIIQLKKAIPISSSRQIVVNGNDLMEWSGQKRGPWLKELIHKLTSAIVNREIQNDRLQIKEWFLREYKH